MRYRNRFISFGLTKNHKSFGMKNVVTVFTIFFFISFSAASQKRWGFADAVGFNSVDGYNGLGIKTKAIVTFQVSVFAILPADKKESFVFMPSLGYLPKGVQFSNILFTDNLGNETGNGNLKRRIDYLQLTLAESYKMQWGSGIEGFIGAGPYIAYALAGKEKVSGFVPVNNSAAPPDKAVDFKAASIKRWDAGINVQVSAIFSKTWLVGLCTDFGILKLNSAGTINAQNRSSRIYVGYVF